MPDETTCFVIGPIGEAGTEVRRRADQVLGHVIAPVVSDAGFTPVRADAIAAPGVITSQIVEHLVADALVVADLTGHNPNVFYELAIRHAVRKPVIQLIDRSESIPFDVSTTRTIPFDHRDLDSVAEAKRELARQVAAVTANPELADSPISTAIDQMVLRGSENPLEASTQEILSSLQEIRAAIPALTGVRGPDADWGRFWGASFTELKAISSEIVQVLDSDESAEDRLAGVDALVRGLLARFRMLHGVTIEQGLIPEEPLDRLISEAWWGRRRSRG